LILNPGHCGEEVGQTNRSQYPAFFRYFHGILWRCAAVLSCISFSIIGRMGYLTYTTTRSFHITGKYTSKIFSRD
jgi:hypothetical protein